MSKLDDILDKIREIIGQMAGAVSVCWEPKPTGVFDSERASKYVQEAVAAIQAMVVEARISEAEYWEHDVVPAVRGHQFQFEVDKRMKQLKAHRASLEGK